MAPACRGKVGTPGILKAMLHGMFGWRHASCASIATAWHCCSAATLALPSAAGHWLRSASHRPCTPAPSPCCLLLAALSSVCPSTAPPWPASCGCRSIAGCSGCDPGGAVADGNAPPACTFSSIVPTGSELRPPSPLLAIIGCEDSKFLGWLSRPASKSGMTSFHTAGTDADAAVGACCLCGELLHPHACPSTARKVLDLLPQLPGVSQI